MRQLRFAGPGQDAAHVIVESTDGLDRYALVIDDALRLAARQDGLPRLSHTDADEQLTPRDIQTRVRAGASPESIAEEAGVAIERVLRFAHPVLQERARVTDEARRARARRTTASGEAVGFGETVDAKLAAHGIEPDNVKWDSCRRPDGQWTVSAGWCEQDVDRFAQWSFSLSSRMIAPLDDTAADLLSDRPLQPVMCPEPEDVATVGGPFDPTTIEADPINPTGPLPTSLRVAQAVRLDDDPVFEVGRDDDDPAAFVVGPVGPHPSQYQPGDPPPRGLGSFFHPETAPAGSGAHADQQLAGSDPVLPLQLSDEAAGTPDVSANGPTGRGHRFRGGQSEEGQEAQDPKAARTRIPSWDDILLGVRRRAD